MGLHHTFRDPTDESTIFQAIDTLSKIATTQQKNKKRTTE